MGKNNFGDQVPGAFNSENSESFLDGEISDGQFKTRLIQTFRSGPLLFGIPEDQISTIAEWTRPTPLPFAPSAVLGVVSVQGRMLTVLDPSRLLEGTTNYDECSWAFIAALRGDEQLALAIEDQDGVIEIPASGLEPPSATAGPAISGILRLDDRVISVIEVKELFSTAMRGRERRRRRF